MREPLTKEDLDRAECEAPDCAHQGHRTLYFNPACHPRSGLVVAYDREQGLMFFHCRTCDAHVASVRL